MADKTVTVHSDGAPTYDYTTLNAAFSGEDGATFDAYSGVLHIVCYNFEDTTPADQAQDFPVWVLHIMFDRELRFPLGQIWYRRLPLKNTRLWNPTVDQTGIMLRAQYTRIKGIQLRLWGSGNCQIFTGIFFNSISGSSIYIDKCILDSTYTGESSTHRGITQDSSNMTVYVSNTIFSILNMMLVGADTDIVLI